MSEILHDIFSDHCAPETYYYPVGGYGEWIVGVQRGIDSGRSGICNIEYSHFSVMGVCAYVSMHVCMYEDVYVCVQVGLEVGMQYTRY